MVLARRGPGTAVVAQPALVALEAQFSSPGFGGGRPAGPGRPLCRSCIFQRLAPHPDRTYEVAPADCLPAPAPADGAAQRTPAAGPDPVAQSVHLRFRLAAAMAGQHLEQPLP